MKVWPVYEYMDDGEEMCFLLHKVFKTEEARTEYLKDKNTVRPDYSPARWQPAAYWYEPWSPMEVEDD